MWPIFASWVSMKYDVLNVGGCMRRVSWMTMPRSKSRIEFQDPSLSQGNQNCLDPYGRNQSVSPLSYGILLGSLSKVRQIDWILWSSFAKYTVGWALLHRISQECLTGRPDCRAFPWVRQSYAQDDLCRRHEILFLFDQPSLHLLFGIRTCLMLCPQTIARRVLFYLHFCSSWRRCSEPCLGNSLKEWGRSRWRAHCMLHWSKGVWSFLFVTFFYAGLSVTVLYVLIEHPLCRCNQWSFALLGWCHVLANFYEISNVRTTCSGKVCDALVFIEGSYLSLFEYTHLNEFCYRGE